MGLSFSGEGQPGEVARRCRPGGARGSGERGVWLEGPRQGGLGSHSSPGAPAPAPRVARCGNTTSIMYTTVVLQHCSTTLVVTFYCPSLIFIPYFHPLFSSLVLRNSPIHPLFGVRQWKPSLLCPKTHTRTQRVTTVRQKREGSVRRSASTRLAPRQLTKVSAWQVTDLSHAIPLLGELTSRY